MIHSTTIDYILHLLCGVPETDDISSLISYGNSDNKTAKVLIQKSSFFDIGMFGTKESYPSLPIKTLTGIPVLFGGDTIEYVDDQIIIHADLVASTFFLISRYEETIVSDNRDRFSRFIGKNSLPAICGFINRPVIDEYTELVRKLLGLTSLRGNICISLTHDIDSPYSEYGLLSAILSCGAALIRQRRIIVYPLMNVFQIMQYDPLYTFPFILEKEEAIRGTEMVYFAKSGGKEKPFDAAIYIHDRAYKKLEQMLKMHGGHIGYHSSFEAGGKPSLLKKELELLEEVGGCKITAHRSHYLRAISPSDFYELIKIGITDDYTMGYADIAGFRLGTARIVRWIDPCTGQLTSLQLHPLIVMDGTLTSADYMNLDVTSAQTCAIKMIDSVIFGCPSVLWHNGSVTKNSDQRKIYLKVMEHITRMFD
ncbi:MAG: hypothetical protein RR413_04945 [Christensenellaceae bacterium]